MTTAICFLEMEDLKRAGIQRAIDQREVAGDVQKVADDDNELAEDDGEEFLEGRSNRAGVAWDGVAKRLRESSTKTS